MRTNGRVFQTVVLSILIHGTETWSVQVANQSMLAVYINDKIHRILHGNTMVFFVSLAYRRSSSKEASNRLATVRNILRVS